MLVDFPRYTLEACFLSGSFAQGNTVIVIEHNLEVIKTADWIVDLGPEGGDKGGKVIASGTPEQIVEVKESYTGEYLKPHLFKKPNKKRV